MSTYRIFHFAIGDNRYVLKDRFSGSELNSIKSYLFQMLSLDTTINFQFDTRITSNSIIEVFKGPTISVNGAFLLNPQSLLNIYSDPIVTNDGTSFYRYDTNSALINAHTLDFMASTNYLLRITPLDTSDNLLGLKSKDDLDILKENLRSVSKLRESRLELTSMINDINNNTFASNDIIPSIKKIAVAERAIINMLLEQEN